MKLFQLSEEYIASKITVGSNFDSSATALASETSRVS